MLNLIGVVLFMFMTIFNARLAYFYARKEGAWCYVGCLSASYFAFIGALYLFICFLVGV